MSSSNPKKQATPEKVTTNAFAVSSEEQAAPRWWNATLLFSVAILLFIGLRPICSEDLWWTIAHGETVLKGTIAPSAEILKNSSSYDADWLSGVPAALFFAFFDTPGLSLLRLLAVAAFLGICSLFLKVIPSSMRLLSWSLIAITSLTMLNRFDPTPLAWEILLAGLLVWHQFLMPLSAIQASTETDSSPKNLSPKTTWLISGGIILLAWAQLAPHVIIGFLIVLFASLRRAERNQWKRDEKNVPVFLPIAISIIAVSLTPRFLLGWYDSAIQTVPSFFVDMPLLTEPQWKIFLAEGLTLEKSLFLITSLFAACVFLWKTFVATNNSSDDSPSNSPNNKATLSLMALWIIMLWLTFTTVGLMPLVAFVQLLLIFVLLSQTNEEVQTKTQADTPTKKQPLGLAMASASILLLVVSLSGWKTNSDSRWGWGVAPQLDIASFQESLDGLKVRGAAHCGDIRSAGMLAWVKLRGLHPWITPTRALVDGDLRDYVSLNQELALGWMHFHPRNDGTAGGWYLRLKHRPVKIRMVIFSSENTEVARKLAPTVWKPMNTIAPSIPYGHANEESCKKRMLEIQGEQSRLATHPYKPIDLQPPFSTQYADLWGVLTGRGNFEFEIDQIRLIWNFDTFIAPIRLLPTYLQLSQNRSAKILLYDIEAWWAANEKKHSGEASLFHSLCVIQLTKDLHKNDSNQQTEDQLWKELGWETPPNSQLIEKLQPAVRLLIAGNYKESLAQLPASLTDPELQFARANLLLLNGELSQAIKLLSKIASTLKVEKTGILSAELRDRVMEKPKFLQSIKPQK